MNDLYNALEICLRGIKNGKSIDSVLSQFPEFAQELRPLLETSELARIAAEESVPSEVKQRGRVHLLQVAKEIRDAKTASRRPPVQLFPRFAIVLCLVGILVFTSTGFVSASSSTLPGDQLYPVKRSWEDLRLFLAFNPGERDLLESQFEQERLDEIDGLLGKRKAEQIEFSGMITHQSDGSWQVSGIPVSVANSTGSPNGGIPNGAPVNIIGITRSDGVVEAQRVQVLQPGDPLPPIGISDKNDSNSGEDAVAGNKILPTVAVVTPQPTSVGNVTPVAEQKSYQFSGVVQAMQNNNWIINGQTVHMENAEIASGIKIGSVVKFDGFFGNDGIFEVIKVEVKSADSSNKPQNNSDSKSSGNSGSGSDSNGGSNGGGEGEDSGH